jgi:hypothetical protein
VNPPFNLKKGFVEFVNFLVAEKGKKKLDEFLRMMTGVVLFRFRTQWFISSIARKTVEPPILL